MQHTTIPFDQTRSFSSFFLDYIQQKNTLQPFYNRPPSISNIADQLRDKANSFSTKNRNTLHDALTRQYAKVNTSDEVKRNLSLIKENNTFTITTGHQLNIFTGPLYFIYKIVTVINACKQLKEHYPDYNFVPVYWIASEDHDYDEIKSFRLYGKKYTWETEQKGAVGRFSPADMKLLIESLPGDVSVFKSAYLKNKSLADAARVYVNSLFGEEGLMVIDGDDQELKSLFANVIQDDLANHTAKRLVEETNQELESLGYKPQVYARDINFFYLTNNLRSRLETSEEGFHVVDTELSFSRDEINELIKVNPACFSPNVILRPLYQEMILPNLAYVGGPAEVVYWLQLKNVFAHYHTPFPVLLPRNFAMIMDHQTARKFDKTGLAITELFEEKNFLFNHWILRNTTHDLSVGKERGVIQQLFTELQQRAARIDPTLGPHVGAEGKRAVHVMESIERKLIRAEKRFQSDKLRQIEAVKDALFPNGNLQERTDNFLNFCQQDPLFIKKLMAHFDPFDFQFNVLRYDSHTA